MQCRQISEQLLALSGSDMILGILKDDCFGLRGYSEENPMIVDCLREKNKVYVEKVDVRLTHFDNSVVKNFLLPSGFETAAVNVDSWQVIVLLRANEKALVKEVDGLV